MGDPGTKQCLLGLQGEDRGWFEKDRLGEEPSRADRQQESSCSWKEGILEHQGLDGRLSKGEEGTRSEGLHRHQEELASLQEGEGALQCLRFSQVFLIALIKSLNCAHSLTECIHMGRLQGTGWDLYSESRMLCSKLID